MGHLSIGYADPGSAMTRLGLLIVMAALAAGCGDNLAGAGGDGPCPGCGPDGGEVGGDAGPLGAFCDDGNPCTVDVLDEDGCHAAPAADGTPCEDGDLCTLGDRCGAGECASGDRAEGELALAGSLDNLSGRRLAIGPDRFAVVTSDSLFRGRVQVVSRSGDRLATLAGWRGDLVLVALGDEEILAAAEPATGLVAVTALGDRSIRLFSTSDSQVAPRGEIEISNQIATMSARGDRLWMCTGNQFAGYVVTLVDVADPDAPVEVGGMVLGYNPCGSIAVSGNGDRVYVNTGDGVHYVDASMLDEGGDPTWSDVIAPAARVTISGAHLLLMAESEIRILAEPSLAEVATVPVGRARAAALFGDRLLVEGNRAAGGGMGEVFVAWYRALGAGAPVLLDEVVTRSYIGGAFGGAFQSASDGETLLTGTRAFDLARDRLDEVRMPDLLPMATLARIQGGVRVYDSAGAAAIDLGDPEAPVLAAGGAFTGSRRIGSVALDVSLPAAALVTGRGRFFEDSTRVPLDPSNPYFASPLRVERWALDGEAALVAEDDFSLVHEGLSDLVTAGDFVYRMRRPDMNRPAGVLQAWWIPALGGGATAAPVFDLALPAAATTTRRGFDVDSHTRIAAVSTDDERGAVLLFYDVSTSPPEPIGELATDAVYPQIRVAGTRVVAEGYDYVVFLDLAAGEVARIPTPDVFERQLLAFDGTTAYWGQLHIVPGQATYSLVAAPFGATEPPVQIDVEGVATSLVPVDGALAVGFDTRLLTVYPHCPGDRPFAPATDENR